MLIWDTILEKKTALIEFIDEQKARLNIKTDSELARRSGISPSQISEVRSGKEKPGRVFLEKLAPVLETTPEHLFSLLLKG